MGCCIPRTKTDPRDEVELSVRSRLRSYSKPPEPPEQVLDLEVTQNPKQPSITLRWAPPANFSRPNAILCYSVKVSSKITNLVLKEVELDGETTEVTFSGRDGLEPLQDYLFAVWAVGSNHVSGEWSMVEGFLGWTCRFPSCQSNRLKLEDGVYDFCSREHKVDFDKGYCLFGDCVEAASYPSTTTNQSPLLRERSHFCGHDHYFRTMKQEAGICRGFFIEVKPGSQEYKNVEDYFRKKWNSKEKRAPSLSLVLAVINPALEERFTGYKQLHTEREKKDSKMLKRLFYGAGLGCDLDTYQIPCPASSLERCSVCSLGVHGFGQLSRNGVTLDKNPASAHEKAQAHMGSLTYSLLLCDVVCANTKIFKRSSRDDIEVSRGTCDAVKIVNKNILKTTTDQVVLYKADAICPRYILLYYV